MKKLMDLASKLRRFKSSKTAGSKRTNRLRLVEALEDRRLLAGVPFQSFLPPSTTGLLETGTHWEFDFADWNGDGTQDLFAINKQGTSGRTEVSILDGSTGYQSFLEVELETPLGQTGADWTFEVADYGGNGQPDLFAINRDFGGRTGVSVLSGFEIPAIPGVTAGTKPFTTFIGGLPPITTVLHQTDATWDFQVADWNDDGIADIFAFDQTGAVVNGTQRTDLHIINGYGADQTFDEHTITVLPATNSNWELLLGGNNDIIAVKKNGTGTNTTEVHVPTATNGFQSYFLQTSTALHETNANWQFEFKDVTGDGNDDLIAIATNGTGSGRTEVHVLTGLQEAQAPVHTIPSGTIHDTNYDVAIPFQIAIETDAGYSGNISSDSASMVQDGTVMTSDVPQGYVIAPIPAGGLAVGAEAVKWIPESSLNGGGSSSEENTAVTALNVTLTVVGTAAAVFKPGLGGPRRSMAFDLKGQSSLTAAEFIVDGNVDVNIGSDSYVGSGTPVRIRNGAKVSGTGSMRDKVYVGHGGTIRASLSPGDSPGILHAQGAYFDSKGALEIELFGSSVGSGYDQLHVTGDVSLGGAHLEASLDFSPSLGQEFMIIRNDGTDTVSGTFQGLPEGASLNIGGKRFHITYRGGTGNDVVLQRNQDPSGGSISRAVDEDIVLTGTVPHSDPDGALGGEFQINTHTSSDQAYPSVAMDTAGNFVVSWQSFDQDGSGYGIYAQRYDADGNALGSEFQVNTHTSSHQYGTSAAMDATGNFVITWSSRAQDGDRFGVYAQRYDADGNGLGGEFQVNTHTFSSQFNPSVAMDAAGNFVVAWTSSNQDGSGLGVYAQRYHGGTVVGQSTVTVNNLDPDNVSFDNVTFGSPISAANIGGVPGQMLLFSGAFTDVGTLDSHSVTVNWGDGSSTEPLLLTQRAGSGTMFGSHVYTTAGTFTVTVTVTDDDGGTTIKNFNVTLADTALLPDTCHSGLTALYIGGTTNADDIQVTAAGNTGAVEAVLNGASQGTFAPTGRIVVFAQAGDDNVQLAGSIGQSCASDASMRLAFSNAWRGQVTTIHSHEVDFDLAEIWVARRIVHALDA